MSRAEDTETPWPQDDPAAVVRAELAGHREAIEALAAMDLGVLSADARQAVEILDQDDS